MRSELQSLKEYQDVVTRIAELDRLLSEIPPEIKNLQAEWESIKERIQELETRKTEQSSQLSEKRTALDEATAKSKKFEEDLHQVTNTREYHAALKEIDSAKKLIHTLKEAVAARNTELEEIGRNMDECAGLEKESGKRYEEAMGAHQESMKDYKAELDEKTVSRNALGKKVPAKLMKQFERIATRRNGIGLAVCVNHICQACNVRVRHSVVDELRKYKRLITCESCKRILFFEEA